jgi:hypothetical protein
VSTSNIKSAAIPHLLIQTPQKCLSTTSSSSSLHLATSDVAWSIKSVVKSVKKIIKQVAKKCPFKRAHTSASSETASSNGTGMSMFF